MSGRNQKKDEQKRLWIRIIALIMAGLMLLGVVLTSVAGYAEEAQTHTQYEMELEVLPDQQLVRVRQSVHYTNTTGGALDGMMFGVYANILRRYDAAPVDSNQLQNAFPEGYAPGGVDFMSVRVNGERAQWGVQGDEELFLRVACDLEPMQSAVFSFEYYLLLPVSSLAVGTGDLTWRLTGFYPIAAAWDAYAQGFVMNGYTAVGNPVYSDAADYHVTISLPETYALAAPGDVQAVNEGGTVHYEIHAEGIRELALIFSRKMTERTAKTQNGTQIQAWGNTVQSAQAMLDAAVEMMNYLEMRLGEYPWERLTLMETEYVYEGVSYPGVMQVSHALCGVMNRAELTQAIRKLCAQQYFSCIALSNFNAAPWLSDALSSYMTLMYTYDTQGEQKYLQDFNKQILPALQITIPGGMTVDCTAERFTSRMEYDIIVIDRGAVVLHDMRQSMGHEVFMKAMREYVQRSTLKKADEQDFLSAVNEVSGRRWDEYLYGQMHNMDDYVGERIEWYE